VGRSGLTRVRRQPIPRVSRIEHPAASPRPRFPSPHIHFTLGLGRASRLLSEGMRSPSPRHESYRPPAVEPGWSSNSQTKIRRQVGEWADLPVKPGRISRGAGETWTVGISSGSRVRLHARPPGKVFRVGPDPRDRRAVHQDGRQAAPQFENRTGHVADRGHRFKGDGPRGVAFVAPP